MSQLDKLSEKQTEVYSQNERLYFMAELIRGKALFKQLENNKFMTNFNNNFNLFTLFVDSSFFVSLHQIKNHTTAVIRNVSISSF